MKYAMLVTGVNFTGQAGKGQRVEDRTAGWMDGWMGKDGGQKRDEGMGG